MKRVLFICTGNTCRSPMAEAIFRDLVRDRTDFEVLSAGTGAYPGDAASRHTADILTDMGVDPSQHRSRPLTRDLLDAATHVFALSRSHLASIEAAFPESADKTYLVSEFTAEDSLRGRDISDPFGAGRDAYEQVRDTLRRILPSVVAYIDQTFGRAALATSPHMHPAASPADPAPALASPPANTVSRVVLGADHGGFELKNAIAAHLRGRGIEVTDLGADSAESVDYPDYADAVAETILSRRADAGILVCTTGLGVCMAANRHTGIQAALARDPSEAALTREHNHANVLCFSGARTSPTEALPIVDTFLTAQPEGGRHARRVGKMNSMRQIAADIVRTVDPDIADAILAEESRQRDHIELIASENFTSRAVMAAQGSCLTNKYAEGYPGRRWYGGCEHVDKAEQLAIERVCRLFGARFANVQPHSGSQANAAVYFSALSPGDRILTMNLAHGGHLTHGHSANFSGKFYEVVHYGVSEKDERIDYDALSKLALECKPRMITAGASAYSRIIDFARMGQIARSAGAWLFVDMAHIAGLVAAGVHPSPLEHADFVTSTTHKSLRGPRGGLILTNSEELSRKINVMVFPGTQGGPLMHVIAAKAVCFHEALQPGFREYQQQVVRNAKSLAAALAARGYRIVSGGTDNHLMLVDLRPRGLNGKIASETLDQAAITVNKNGIPFDTEKITLGGGIRIGTPAVTTRGMKEAEMNQIAAWIDDALQNRDNPSALARIRAEVIETNKRFPLP